MKVLKNVESIFKDILVSLIVIDNKFSQIRWKFNAEMWIQLSNHYTQDLNLCEGKADLVEERKTLINENHLLKTMLFRQDK